MPDGSVVHTVYVEMKNKHNTMNSASAGKTFIKMQNQLLNDDDCACFLVEAIAQRSQNIKWETTVDKKKVGHKLIRRVSIFIISKYIPYDNIFDVSYYISTIIENSNIINNLALTGDTFLINLYSSSFVSLVWLLVIFTLCFAILFSIVNIILNRLILFSKNKN